VDSSPTRERIAALLARRRIWATFVLYFASAVPLYGVLMLARGNGWLEGLAELVWYANWLGGFFLWQAVVWRVIWAFNSRQGPIE
jgi:hypothetical protein